jgi:hypothetical protein
MNLFESLKLIQDTAQKAVKVEVMPMPNDPEQHLVLANGTATAITTRFQEKPRNHLVESIEDFAAAYERWYLDSNDVGRAIAKPEPVETEIAGEEPAAALLDQIRTPNVWLDLHNWRLVFFTDEPLRRSRVTLKLTPAPQFQTLCAYRDPVSVDQPSLVRLLRHDLARCVDASVLLAFRSVDFQKMINAKRNITNQRQSMDSDIVATVGGDPKPEEIVATVPVLASRELEPFRVRVELTIDIDIDKQRFTLQALPGDLDLALEDARIAIRKQLENDLLGLGLEGVTILCGNPGKSGNGDE